MKKIYLLLAATFVGSSFLTAMNSYAVGTQKTHYAGTAADKASGTVSMIFHSADIGVGYTWGDGVLHYKGHSYKFKIKGGDVVALGFSKSQATGRVYQLNNLYDFAGKYAAASGEATAGVGVAAGNMKNANNVIIHMDASTIGGRLAGAPGGFEIKFVDKHLQKVVEARKEQKKEQEKDVQKPHKTSGKVSADDLNGQQLQKMKK